MNNSSLMQAQVYGMRQRYIFWFWIPLFASWWLMTAQRATHLGRH